MAGSPADIPVWLAPTAILSAVATVVNLSWNVYNTHRSSRLRGLDLKRAAYSAQVMAPLEACLSKFEDFLLKLKAAERTILQKKATTPAARAKRYGELQTDAFEPVMEQFQMTLRRVSGFQDLPLEVNWFAFEDTLDPVWDAFDTLCRDRAGDDRVKTALMAMEQAVHDTCDAVRSEMNAMVFRISELKP